MELKFPNFSKQKAADWFLKTKNVCEANRAINFRKMLGLTGGFVGLVLLFVLLWPKTEAEKKHSTEDAAARYPESKRQTSGSSDPDRMTPPGTSGIQGGGQGAHPSRNRNSNQIIRRSAQNSDSTGQIPMGSAVGARLLNAVVSANSSSPVIAAISSDEVSHEIPPGSKAIGTAKFDEAAKRISVTFHTIVYPDGEQHGVQGVAMMPDGSAGLEGNYSSGEGKRRFGRFMGTFVGGLADGMKARTEGGVFSGPIEPGSVRNGILNGVTQSAEDEAKQSSDSMGNTTASMSLPAGTEFIFYFEQEFRP